MITKRTLKATKVVIKRAGWRKFGEDLKVGKKVGVCVGTALAASSKLPNDYYRLGQQFFLEQNLIPESPRGAEFSLIDWNDDKERTEEDVYAMLDKAIELAPVK